MMNTAYVISSNVTINALLPHRTNVSIMIESPTFTDATLHFRRLARLAAGLKSDVVENISLHYVSSQLARIDRRRA